MKRDRFAKPVGPPCELWQQWARDAPKFRSTSNLMHSLPIDKRTVKHMTVEMTPDPLPPVLQQYPLPRTEKNQQQHQQQQSISKNNLLNCDDSDDDYDDDNFVDNLTLLAILESQREAEKPVTRSKPTVMSSDSPSKKGSSIKEKDSYCFAIDPAIQKQGPMSSKGNILKSTSSDGHILDGVKMLHII